MFAPNRLLTTKEQWLLAGVIAAVLAGSVTLYLHGRSQGPGGDPFVTTGDAASSAPPPAIKPAGTQVAAGVVSPPKSLASVSPVSPPQVDAVPDMQSTPMEEVPAAPAIIGVAAMGAVLHPGLYRVPADYRVADLITRAGGATEKADLSEIALTARLIDETTLTIPEKPVHSTEGTRVSARRGTATHLLNPMPYLKRYANTVCGTSLSSGLHSRRDTHDNGSVSSPEPGASQSALLNINTASEVQLQELPGIGTVLAGAIIAERERKPFADVNELDRVPGIGEKRLSALRTLVTAR